MTKKSLANATPITNTSYIPNLAVRNTGFDSLRGIFAITVFFGHVELIKYYSARMEHFLDNDIFFQLGRIGVTGFFALSGFLITVHLLNLKESAIPTGKKIGTFYIKRILRIWPLYYAIILLSLYVFPHINALRLSVPPYATDVRLNIDKYQYYYLFLLPQIPLANTTVLPFAEPSWSIGIEEIFYLFIPLIIMSVDTKRLQWILIPACISVIIARHIVFTSSNAENPYIEFWPSLMIISRFDCIIIGCVAGIYYYLKKPFIARVNKVHFAISAFLVLLLTITMSRMTYQYFHYALLFTVMILFVALNPENFLNNKIFRFYGKISFSLYMTHEIAIVFMLNLHDFNDYHPALFHIVSFIAATGLAFVSYKLLEEPFLKIKSKVGKEKTT